MIKSTYRLLFFVLASCCVSNCILPERPGHDQAAFHAMLDHYWKDLLALKPMDATVFGDNSMNDQFPNTATAAYRNELRRFYLRYADSLKDYTPDLMNEPDALSYQVLDYDIRTELKRAEFDTWKIPFTQFGDAGNTLSGNLVLAMGQFGSGSSSQPFRTVADYDNWLKRVHGYITWCDSAIGNFRQGIASGYVLPKALVVKMVNICDGLVAADVKQSIFYGPVKNFPTGFSAAEKSRLTTAFTAAINNELNPAHARLAAFLSGEYLAHARNSAGADSLPGGLEYYKFCVKDWTTTDETSEEIYRTGLAEVKRIGQEMEAVKDSAGFKGDLRSFFQFMTGNPQFMPFKTPGQVIDSFRHIYQVIQPALKKYFVLFSEKQFRDRTNGGVQGGKRQH